jgi:hypothetical protein
MLHLAQRATILPRHACGVFALFDKARFIEHQDTLGITQGLGHELMIIPQQLFLIPHRLTQKALQAADTAPLDGKSHRLNRFPGQGAVLPHHVIQAMPAGFTPSKTIMEDTLELLSLVREAFHITDLHGKGGNHERLTCSAATR